MLLVSESSTDFVSSPDYYYLINGLRGPAQSSLGPDGWNFSLDRHHRTDSDGLQRSATITLTGTEGVLFAGLILSSGIFVTTALPRKRVLGFACLVFLFTQLMSFSCSYPSNNIRNKRLFLSAGYTFHHGTITISALVTEPCLICHRSPSRHASQVDVLQTIAETMSPCFGMNTQVALKAVQCLSRAARIQAGSNGSVVLRACKASRIIDGIAKVHHVSPQTLSGANTAVFIAGMQVDLVAVFACVSALVWI